MVCLPSASEIRATQRFEECNLCVLQLCFDLLLIKVCSVYASDHEAKQDDNIIDQRFSDDRNLNIEERGWCLLPVL